MVVCEKNYRKKIFICFQCFLFISVLILSIITIQQNYSLILQSREQVPNYLIEFHTSKNERTNKSEYCNFFVEIRNVLKRF